MAKKMKKPKKVKRPLKKKRRPQLDRNAIIEECARRVPNNWCDSLLSGSAKVIDKSDGREIEALLRGVQDRIRGLKADQ